MQPPPPAGGPGFPFQPPQAPQPGMPGFLAPGAPQCPRCKSPNVHKPTWTFWGGWLGPKIINHWVCKGCSFGFNPTTGQSTGGAIAIYVVVSIVIAVALSAFFFASQR